MNYQEAIDYIYSKLPMFSRIGNEAIKKGLTNITALCEALGNPHKNRRFIHIAGTNGKGSVSHMLAAILQTAGYKTGLYTSPHLKDIRERVKINGNTISEEELIEFIEKVNPLIEEIKPSYFEITVAMAFYYFARHNTSIAILETGLGGRLDSTNIIIPILSVITNISYDHVQILGNTLGEIAVEKAGIIKKEIPVVIGESHIETKNIFINAATEKNAPISFADDAFTVTDWGYEHEQLVVEVSQTHKVDHKKYQLDLTGAYQRKNLLTVLQACRQLNQLGVTITDEAISKGLQHAKKLTGLHGRWETIHQNPRVVVDVAHNEDGVKQLLQQIEITSFHNLHIILGMVKDKDVQKVLSMLPAYASYYFTQSQSPRALPANELQFMAAQNNLHGHTFPNVNDALLQAKSHAHKDDLILVCGSIFLAGEIL